MDMKNLLKEPRGMNINEKTTIYITLLAYDILLWGEDPYLC